MFKVKILTGEKRIQYKPLSVAVKFLIEDKKLESTLNNAEKTFNIKLSELQKKNFLGKNDILTSSRYDGKPDEIILYKVNKEKDFSPDYFRSKIAGLISQINKSEVRNLYIFIPSFKNFSEYFSSEEYFYRTFVEGIYYGNYYFSIKKEKDDVKELTVFLYADNDELIEQAISMTSVIMKGVNKTRDLQNAPSNELFPEELANRIKKMFDNEKVDVKVFDEAALEKRKMGGLLAVGNGSEHKPRMIIIDYNKDALKGKKKIKSIAVVGKGVTFDSGGISIKPAQSMSEMKGDMSGAAVVAGLLYVISNLNLPIQVTGIIPAAENMPSGSSMRPGDILTTASGKTIEVDNTDAEGRIILSDGLDYASKLNPDLIIDLATLTGACLVALGSHVAGLFTKDEELAQTLYKIGLQTSEKVWPMPMWDEYHQLNKSEVADVKNLGGRWGGAITAAKFLENFVNPKIKWAHIDIAGPAGPHEFNNYNKKYFTGFGVRLLFEYLYSGGFK